MAVKVFSTDRHFNLLGTEAVLKAGKSKEVKRALAQKYQRRVRRIAQRHHENLTSEVKGHINAGFASPGRAGARIVKAVDGDGKPVTYRTRGWPELTESYRKRKPYSRRMWKKRGRLARFVSAALPRKKSKVQIRQTERAKYKGRKRVTARHLLTFPFYGGQGLNVVMTAPFVAGDERRAKRFTINNQFNRNNSDLIAYPELAERLGRPPSRGGEIPGPANRPWVAGLSGRLGQRMHRSIRKLKT